MAASKNKRKKGSKRSAQHSAPPGYFNPNPKPKKLTEQERKEQQQEKQNKKLNIIRTVGMIILLIGFSFAYWAGDIAGDLCIIGYPIAILGGMMCFYSARHSVPRRIMPQICYIFFIFMIIMAWFSNARS